MIFNSIEFFVFFFITSLIYFLIPGKYQKYFLIIISIFFYGYFIPWHLIVLLAMVALNFFYGISSKTTSEKSRKLYLILILICNISVLFFFKYFNFFNANIEVLAKLIHWNYPIYLLQIAVPLGISFYIFKCISYDIEVHRKNIPVEKRFDIFLLYVILYPELLAGPIDRPQNLIPQLEKSYSFDYTRVANGLKLIAWGIFKKVVIADRLALSVNYIYGHLHDYKGMPLVITSIFFAFQIYCDFSGYSDIAIGSGQVLGLKLMNNFDRPYFSRSISEFWRRWHISLSFWFRDYVFLPVAFKSTRFFQKAMFRSFNTEKLSYFNATIITMFLIGLWHGARWTFIIWGLLIGLYLIFSQFTKKTRAKIVKLLSLRKYNRFHRFLQIIISFSLICIAWIFFRAENIQDAYYIFKNIFVGFKFQLGGYNLGIGQFQVLLSFIFILFLILAEAYSKKHEDIVLSISEKPRWIRWVVYYAIVLFIIFFGEFGEASFLYFKF